MPETPKPQEERPEERAPLIIIIVGLLLIVTLLAFAIITLAQRYELINNTTTSSTTNLATYFDANTKQGSFSYSNGEDGEFWVKNNNFLVEFNQDNGYKRWIISNDGEKAYLCYEEDQRCEPAKQPAEVYLLRWYLPNNKMVDGGRDDTKQCDKSIHVLQQEYQIERLDNDSYVDNIVYCTENNKLIYTLVVLEGKELEPAVVYTFDKGETNLEIDDIMFELPYEVIEKE
jgi:hypothetical protein